MAKRPGFCLLALVLVASVLTGGVVAAAAGITPAQRTAAINTGLAWLATKQHPDGHFGNVADATKDYYPVALTGLAVLKFEEYAKESFEDPFSDTYAYHQAVEDGWKYLSTMVGTEPGNGLYFSSCLGGLTPLTPYDAQMYETGIVMMALEASGTTGRMWPVQGSGMTYSDVLKHCVEWVVWAQDPTTGGWPYAPSGVNKRLQEDNSIVQWPVLGLMAAELWAIPVPASVKSLLSIWTNTTQNGGDPGCFVYRPGRPLASSNPSTSYVATTAAGLIELTYCDPLAISNGGNWLQGATCIADHWAADDPYCNIGNLYAMYAVMKAALLAPPPSPVSTFKDSNGTSYDWQALYDQWIVKNQVPAGNLDAGSWPAKSALPWSNTNFNAVLATEYALLILEKVAPVYDPLASFEDLLRRQAERLASFESLLKVGWGDLARGQQLAFLQSFEDLLRSQAERLQSFEDLLNASFSHLNQLQRVTFLESFEDLLKKQAEGLASFEELLKAYDVTGQTDVVFPFPKGEGE